MFFGATDGPMTPEQMQQAPGKVLHLPTVLGAVVPIYNLPGVKAELKFTGPLLADIFLGKVTKWNDPAIVKNNAGVSLPATDITVVHRADGSGTTYIWVDYLSKVSPEWMKKAGVNTSVNWPTGLGGKGNEGVAGLVSQTPGSLGYVELIYALQNKISYGSVQNMEGEFVPRHHRVGHRRGRGGSEEHAQGLPRVDHQRAGQGRVPHLFVHVAPALREPEGQGAEQSHGGLHEVGAHRRTEIRGGSRLCAAAR